MRKALYAHSNNNFTTQTIINQDGMCFAYTSCAHSTGYLLVYMCFALEFQFTNLNNV